MYLIEKTIDIYNIFFIDIIFIGYRTLTFYKAMLFFKFINDYKLSYLTIIKIDNGLNAYGILYVYLIYNILEEDNLKVKKIII